MSARPRFSPELEAQLEAQYRSYAPKRSGKWERRYECRFCHYRIRISELKHGGGFNQFECIEGRACLARAASYGPGPTGDALDFAVCSCRESYTRGDFIGLPCPPKGSRQPSFDDEGRPYDLELRNCACGSTMARRLR